MELSDSLVQIEKNEWNEWEGGYGYGYQHRSIENFAVYCTEIDGHLMVKFFINKKDFYLSTEDLNDVAFLRRLGRSISNIPTLHHLDIDTYRLPDNEDTQPLAECIGVVCGELKNNTSVEELHFRFTTNPQFSLFDLGYFLRNNANIKQLRLSNLGRVTLEQSHIISTVLESVQLRTFEIESFNGFNNDGSFQQIVSACLGIETLKVQCDRNFQFTAIAALLRNSRASLQQLIVTSSGRGMNGSDKILALEEIAASLVDNSRLRVLRVALHFDSQEVLDNFEKLLCDSSSIEHICNSNHVLEETNFYRLSARAQECLELNKDENKNKVIRNKIMQYYFTRDFNLAPFVSMPLSVLSEVMSKGESMSNKQTSIFELLRGIPELCNVSSRRVETFEHRKSQLTSVIRLTK
jgi:hypothetical protein